MSDNAPPNGVLSKAEILERLEGETPLVEFAPGGVQATQLQPNGVDLTLERVYRLQGQPVIADTVTLPVQMPVSFASDGEHILLSTGSYVVALAEKVNIPLDLMALVYPRSSLIRSGISLHVGAWDAGYSGYSQVLMVIHHQTAVVFKRGARIAQMVFFRLGCAVGEGYSGQYQGEGQ